MEQDNTGHAAALATILVIDDEELLRQFLCELLTLQGYRTYAAQDGLVALDIYRRQFREIDLVLTDLVMPGMHGLEVLDVMRALNPTLKAAIMSGYCDRTDLAADSLSKVVGMLRKPFSAEQLQGLLDKALHGEPLVPHALAGELAADEEGLLVECAYSTC